MSFWQSTHVNKARKDHTCKYCGKKIKAGDPYHRETGTWEGDFNDYCLCERCKAFILKHRPYSEDEFGNFYDELMESDLIPNCQVCGRTMSGLDMDSDRMAGTIECDECGERYRVNLTMDDMGTITQMEPDKEDVDELQLGQNDRHAEDSSHR